MGVSHDVSFILLTAPPVPAILLPSLPPMCDDNGPCGHGGRSNGTRDHCHYEHRHRSTRGRGPLRRTSTSNVINCHQHHGSKPKHCLISDQTTQQCWCHQSNSQACRNQLQDSLSELINQLRAQQRCNNNGQVANGERDVLHQLLQTVLNQQSRTLSMQLDSYDALLDRLLRLIGSPNSGSNTAPVPSSQQSDEPPPYSAHYARSGSGPEIPRGESIQPLRPTYSDWCYGPSVISGPFIPRTVYAQTRYLIEEPVWAVEALPAFDSAWTPVRTYRGY
jgi:hypothetical protein